VTETGIVRAESGRGNATEKEKEKETKRGRGIENAAN
jgi:hypothetical protein